MAHGSDVVVQSLSHVQLFATPWTAACQASLSFTIFCSLLKLMSIESVMPSNHLVLCCPLLLPSVFPSIRVFSNESALCIKWPKYWSFRVLELIIKLSVAKWVILKLFCLFYHCHSYVCPSTYHPVNYSSVHPPSTICTFRSKPVGKFLECGWRVCATVIFGRLC